MSEYLDTSIVVKWFKEEESNHFEALLLLDRIKDFVMSEYGLLELVRALSKAKYPVNRIENRLTESISCTRKEIICKNSFY